MGVDFRNVGYLCYCSEKERGESDLKKLHINDSSLNECIRPFKLHDTIEEQYKWHL